MVFCPICGNENNGKAKYCMECGIKLSEYSVSVIGKEKISQRSYATSGLSIDPDLFFDASILKNSKTGIKKK